MIWNRQKKVRVASGELEKFLGRIEKELRVGKQGVTVCFVGDAEIARMNKEFRGKTGPTDVLSFPAKEKQWRGKKKRAEKKKDAHERDSYLGDIAIAPSVARRYAKKNGRTLDSELRVLILHGVLHLLGYDHETDRGEMDRIEQRMRRRFGLA